MRLYVEMISALFHLMRQAFRRVIPRSGTQRAPVGAGLQTGPASNDKCRAEITRFHPMAPCDSTTGPVWRPAPTISQASGDRPPQNSMRVCSTLLFISLHSLPAFADYMVTGKFQYQDREFDLNGFTGTITARPIRFASVRIMAGSSTLATGTTSTSGDFSITVPGTTAQSITALCVTTSGPLLDVRVANDDFTFGDLYSVSSAPVSSPGSGTVDMGTTLATAESDPGKAFNIWDVIQDGLEFVASPGANTSLPSVKLTVIWRATHTRTGSFFQGGATNKFIYAGVNAGYDDTIIAHEFGHFVDNVFSKSDSPGGAHTLGDNNQDIRLSWSEGLATFLGSHVRNFKGYPRPDIYVNTDGTNLSFSYEIESLNGNVTLANKTGSTNEVAVTAALWDITDGTGTGDGSPGTDDDTLARPFADVWKVLRNYLPTVTAPGITIEDFWDGWFSPIVNNGSLLQMEAVFAAVNGIEFKLDALEPDNSLAAAPNAGLAQVPPLGSGARVLINEVDLGTVDAVELYNAGSAEADLTGWRVINSRTGFSTATFTIPLFKLAPGAFVILSEATGTNTNSVLFFGTNISWANGVEGACALIDAGGTGRDFVRWGGSPELPPTGTSFTGNPASPVAGRTLGRSFTSADADAAGDWTEQIPTPGSFNQSGQEKHHTFYPEGDVDLVSFNAVSGRNYLVESLNLQSGADTVIDLLSTDGTSVLASNDDFGTSKATRLVWTAPSSGKFYIRSRRFGGGTNLAQYGSYDLRITESTSPLAIALPATLSVSKPGQGGKFQRISDAIAAASSGDTIQIMDNGLYVENPTVTGKNVTLKAASGKSPVLDGRSGFALATLNLANAKNVRIEGLTILGGNRGIRVSGGVATIANTVVFRASDPSGFSDGIQVSGAGSSATIVNCTLINNGRLGVGVFNDASARVVNSIVKNNLLGDISGNVPASNYTVRNSLVGTSGFAGTNGNIDGDPAFLDPGNDDYRLRASSPGIDKGDAGDPDLPLTDADGIPRSIDGNGDATAVPDMGAYEYLPPGILTSTSIFPQVAAGGGYRTSVIGVNTGAVPALVNVSLTKSDGDPFPVTVLNKAGSFFNLSIAPMGTSRLETTVSGGTVSGYAKFLSNIPVNGSALFKVISGDKILSEAGVGLSKPTRSFIVYVDNLNNALSGYAVANFGAAPANLNLTLRDKNGFVVEIKSFSLLPGRHIAKFAFQEFPSNASPGFEGSIEFTSDQDVAAVALRYDNTTLDSAQQVFSTIPVLVDEAATTLYFPQVADGGGYKTNFILVNSTSNSTTARLDFFASDGTPLILPIGGVPRTSIDVPLSVRGVARVVTDGTSSGVKVGWVRVTCTVALGGSAIFQTVPGARITSEAGVASSPLASHFTTYVESLGFAESGMALCNPNSIAVTITLKLRNSAGEIVATTNFGLPPLGHIPRFFTQLFPGAFDEFEGTLEVLTTGPVSAVALRYDNQGGTVFATIPVIVIP